MGLRFGGGDRAGAHPDHRLARPQDRRAWTPAATARACTRSPCPRIGGLAIVIGILVPALLFVDLDGPYPGILIGTAGGRRASACSTTRAGCAPGPSCSAVVAARADPGARLAPDDGPPERAGGRLGQPRLGLAYPITILWIAFLANLVNLIDGMDGLAAGIVAIAAGAFALLAVSFGAHRRRRAGRHRLRRDARRSCAATTTRRRSSWATAGRWRSATCSARIAVQGVLKTAATIALAGPLLVMAVPILDTSFVVLKRLKYRARPGAPTTTTSTTASCASASRSGAPRRTCTCGRCCWRPTRSCCASCRRGRSATGTSAHSLIAGVVGLGVLAASLWMVYALEILKARHLRAIGLRPLRARGADGGRRGERESARRPSRLSALVQPACRLARSSPGQRQPQQLARVAPAPAARTRAPRRLRSIFTSAGSVRKRRRPSRASCSSTAPMRALEDRPDGRAEHGGLAVHGAARPTRARRRTRPGCGRPRRARARSRARARARATACALLGRAREHDGLGALAAPTRCAQQPRAAAGSPSRRGRARRRGRCGRRRAAARGRRPSWSSTAAVGLEVRQVVLLLEARVADRAWPAARRSGAAARPGSRPAPARGWPAGS